APHGSHFRPPTKTHRINSHDNYPDAAGTPAEQYQWAEELLERTTFAAPENAPHICILDTGVNHGHPLLAPALADPDLHTIEPDWGVEDQHGHGTNMAGLALWSFRVS
ncbi:S8 family serine peptidase, partial [Pseudomonas sp. UBA7530]|uniref:S8 family serine peptidase n=1 Tax=Pseudomonas sp. UBA7530 TaxID=1947341 RepID=UPI0025DFEAD7